VIDDNSDQASSSEPCASGNFRRALLFVCKSHTNKEDALVVGAGEVALLEVMVRSTTSPLSVFSAVHLIATFLELLSHFSSSAGWHLTSPFKATSAWSVPPYLS